MITAFRVSRGGAPGHRAFEELLAANLDSLYRTALRLCRGRTEEAEDLLQDSVLRAFGFALSCHRAESTAEIAAAAIPGMPMLRTALVMSRQHDSTFIASRVSTSGARRSPITIAAAASE